MNRALAILPAAVLLASGAEAATVIARTQIDSPTPQEIRDSVAATSSRLGIPGLNDFGIDEAIASADLRTGELKFLVRDGIQTGRSSLESVAVGFASIQETLTFFHNPAEGPKLYQLGVDFTAFPNLLVDRFGLINQPPGFPIGGRPELGTEIRMQILEPRSVPGSPPFFNTSSATIRQTMTGLVRGFVDDPTFPSLSNIDVQEVDFSNIGNVLPSQPSRVTNIETDIALSNEAFLQGSIVFDILVDSTLTLDFLVEVTGIARGGFGTFAGIASLNTSSLSIALPEGGSFSSGSGLFLTAANGGVSQVPLPPTAVLLLSALVAAPIFRRRRRAGSTVTSSS